jgi:glycosyltransferase involved in cell wall biosynthesis
MQSAKELFQKKIHQLEMSVGKSFNQAAPVLYIEGILSPIDMPRLYTSATHYISTSRGEGFDLPMLEAGVSGLQLIAPRHSAYLDYLLDDIAHLISVKAVEARLPDDPATGEFFAGAYWWEPDQVELCEKIRIIIDGKMEKKLSARKELSKLSWSRTAELLEKVIF